MRSSLLPFLSPHPIFPFPLFRCKFLYNIKHAKLRFKSIYDILEDALFYFSIFVSPFSLLRFDVYSFLSSFCCHSDSPPDSPWSPFVHANTHPRIPNKSALCLPSFAGTFIIALVIAWFRLHYFEERPLSQTLPNCLRSLAFMMHRAQQFGVYRSTIASFLPDRRRCRRPRPRRNSILWPLLVKSINTLNF